MILNEDRIYEIASGAIDPSTLSNEERDAYVTLFAKPNSSTVDILANIHTRATNDILAIEEEIKALQECKAAFKKVQEDAEEGMLRYCSDEMNTKVTRNYAFAIKESKSADIVDETAIPPEYQTKQEIVKINKALILNDLKLDKEIPGAQLKVNKKVKFTTTGGY